MVTKDAYQEVEGFPAREGDYLQSAYSTSIAGIQNATERWSLHRMKRLHRKDGDKISKKRGSKGHGSWMSTELENTDTEDYFTADRRGQEGIYRSRAV